VQRLRGRRHPHKLALLNHLNRGRQSAIWKWCPMHRVDWGRGGGLTRLRQSLSVAQLPLNAGWAIGLESGSNPKGSLSFAAAPLRTDPGGLSLSNVMRLDCTGLPSALAATS
jgi:hypothetical protein